MVQPTPVVTVNGESISWKQVLGYLQIFGRLQPFVQEIVVQHIIYQELQARGNLEITLAEVEQAVIDFRLQQRLADPDNFQQWLSGRGIDYPVFQSRVALGVKLEKLTAQLSEPKLEKYFEEKKGDLEELELCCLIMSQKSLAEELREKIVGSEISFEQIVQEYILIGGAEVNVLRGKHRRNKLPAELREAMESGSVGEIAGPLPVGDRWALFRIEGIVPAVLEGQIKRELEYQIFQQWLADKLKTLTVKLVAQ
jgi:parvulin-like peptidyl-prolyl isomerase